MRPIDADKFKIEIKTECNPYGNPTISYEDGCRVLEMIDQQPTIIHCKDNTDKCLMYTLGLIGEIVCRARVHGWTLTNDDRMYISKCIDEIRQKVNDLWSEETDIKDNRDIVFRNGLYDNIDDIKNMTDCAPTDDEL